MKRIQCTGGFTIADMVNSLLLIAVMMGMTATLGRRAVGRYQLSAAVRMLSMDVARVKTRSIQTNAVNDVFLESERGYRAAGTPRQLPLLVRFDEASSDTVSFNGIGAVADGATHRFVLVNAFGDSREVFVYASGGQEIRKL